MATPINDLVRQFTARIRTCRTAEIGRDILNEITMARHNYFAYEFCNAINIEYRNDVPALDIVLEMIPDFDPNTVKIPNLTPDNYFRDGNKIYVIDFKVSVSDESSEYTYKKYNTLLGEVFNHLGIPYEIVIIRIDPSNMRLHISSDDFMRLFPNIILDVHFDWYFNLKEQLFERFKDDEEFMALTAYGEFTPTIPWVDEPTDELWDHPIFKEFMLSMPEHQQEEFLNAMDFNSFTADKWNDLLHTTMRKYKGIYDEFIRNQSKKLFQMDENFKKPTREEILLGWNQMVERIRSAREVTPDLSKQKPSIHFIWSPNDPKQSNENIQKILRLSKLLKRIDDRDVNSQAFKYIGELMDFSEDIEQYTNFCSRLKAQARSSLKPKDTKITPIQIGNSTVMWEQQFKFDTNVIPKEIRLKFLKEFCGIGNHKLFEDRMLEDLDLEKPRILDFTNKDVLNAAHHMVVGTKQFLKEENNLDKIGNMLEEYKDKIRNANEITWDNVEKICKSRFWQAINDFSVIIKNMLSVSQYNKHNTFRVVCSANNNFYGLLYPAASIKSKRSTIVFSTITIHNDEKDVLNCGALYKTYKIGNVYVSISKAIRLDKERCQRLVTSPGLFMLTSLMFKGDNDIDLNDIMSFSFFTSLSITKSMLSLTEPSRYMIMNSLALSSHVREYIAEKFSPYTKTLFSVYMTELIRRGCMSANNQKDLISLKNVFLNEFEITQKGVSNDRDLQSIWFPGKVNLKEYINQVYLPFYFNAKGLHNKHHVMIDLAKTVLEIELEQRQEVPSPWSKTMDKQSANLDILIFSIAKMLNMDTSKNNHLRSRIENRNNFKRSLTSISTFTSSKSCIKIGDFFEYKSKTRKIVESIKMKESKKTRIANTEFVDEDDRDNVIAHSTYVDLIKSVPRYTDYISTKVFDRLYEMYKTDEIEDKPAIEIIMDTMRNHKDFKFCFFNKGQKTAKDREIFVGEFEAKLCLYGLERISKERCKLNPEEMISEPGDGKLKKLELNAESEIRYLIEATRGNDRIKEQLDDLLDQVKGIKLEINADMSKWSAQDVFFKYFWLVVLDPILYPYEKQRIIYFLCNYMNKELILPDEMMCSLLDQKAQRANDIIREMTNNFQTNCVNIKRNWLQGNLNYTSSYIHSCSMMVFKDIVKDSANLLEGRCNVNSLVHSDDNQTSVIFIQSKLHNDFIINFICQTFENCCRTFGNQANMKKTYITNHIKEFVSLFNIYGEPFSIYGRFLLPAVGDCAYIGPYEDMASRLSATQTAIKHGCPPSLAWVSIALNFWITFSTYNMLPGQQNDPTPIFNCKRNELPIELCGTLESDLSTVALIGLESGNISFLTKILKKMSKPQLVKESVQTQCNHIMEWDIDNLTDMELMRFKILRYIVLDTEISEDNKMGETSEMRSRSLITPRKFTTTSSLEKLISYKDFQATIVNKESIDDLFQYLIDRPELLVTKGETSEDYMKTILFRYNSKKFKESLSIQSPTQLFIEQILFSNKPTIDYSGIQDRFTNILDMPKIQQGDNIIGRKTIPEAFKSIKEDLSKITLTLEDINLVYTFCILNDPLNITACNAILLSQIQSLMEKTSLSSVTMPEFRNMKLIRYSPALVLRAYIHNDFTIGHANENMLRRDVFHLHEFIKETRMLERMQVKIIENEELKGERDLLFEIKELTKFYQTCYDYVKSTEHKVKVFILPMKVYTAFDFCATIHGNLIKDKGWYSVHYLKQIVSGTSKAIVSRTPASEQVVVDECFKLLSHFCDTFIAEDSRIPFLKKIFKDFTYKGIKVADLYNTLKKSHKKQHFLPLLFRTGDLEQGDLDRYDAAKSYERVSWNDWQINRNLNTGAIDLTIKGYQRALRIIGEDDELKLAELEITKGDNTPIETHGRKLLNTKHNLRFEKMMPVPVMKPNTYYICYQKKTSNSYIYLILSSALIESRNSMHVSLLENKPTKLTPVCPVVVAQVDSQERINLYQLKFLNPECEVSRMKVTMNEFITIRRSHFSKMIFFDGPELVVGNINITKLIQTPALLSKNYNSLSQIPLITLSKIFSCTGEQQQQDEFEFLSDEIMEDEESEQINTVPIFTITYTKKSKQGHTYKKCLQEALRRGLQEMESEFNFNKDGFFSPKNIGIISLIVSLIDQLHTNEWSSIVRECIHMAYFNNGKDVLFHNFRIPKAFLKEAIGEKPNWEKIKVFLDGLHATNRDSYWDQLLEQFKEKCRRMIDEQIKIESQNWGDILDEIDDYQNIAAYTFD
ncbi:RNA-dependent RNA polymerase [Enseada virus]|uniref:RNA-directed RNA polymerase L n=1 Tax=Enseada virus TaxID=1821545 RepID=A0A142K3J7_9VIRU|nr:RNA-dependent RNA polymerase [Enseada virus]AMR98952.1 RNA-dependent RNA polymerase [Enseada virus]